MNLHWPALRTSTVNMVAKVTLALALICPWWDARGDSIVINPGPAPTITSSASVAFDDLDGTGLNGQTLSLDFTWDSGKFIRLFTATDPSFAALLTFQTNMNGLVGFLHGSGYLVDQNGNALSAAEDLGSASGNNGSLTAALFPLLSGSAHRPLDFYGMHLDLVLPDTAMTWITGSEFDLVTPGARRSDRFGIGPGVPADIVPELGSTWMLLSLGVGAILRMNARFRVAAR